MARIIKHSRRCNLDVNLLELVLMQKLILFFVEIGKIGNHIIGSTKKLTKKSTKTSLIDKISKRLLELEFEENHYSIKSKCLNFVV